MTTIKFKKTLSARGKNGLMKQTGIDIFGSDALMFAPTNTKGSTDSCFLEFPYSQINELAQALKSQLDNHIESINRMQAQFKMVVLGTKTGKVIKMHSLMGSVSHAEILEKANDLIGYEKYWRLAVSLHDTPYPF